MGSAAPLEERVEATPPLRTAGDPRLSLYFIARSVFCFIAQSL